MKMKVIQGNRIDLEREALRRLIKGDDLTDLKERLKPKGQLRLAAASDTAEQPAPPQ